MLSKNLQLLIPMANYYIRFAIENIDKLLSMDNVNVLMPTVHWTSGND